MTFIPAIPGTGSLGWGFNIFGAYSSDSKRRPMFPMTTSEKRQWTYEPTDQSYLVPDNSKVEVIAEGDGVSQVFESRTELESHFAGKAKIHGSYGAFSGQFEASYGHTTKSDSDYMFSIFFFVYHAWRLWLKDDSAKKLADWVTEDPDFSELPSTFDNKTKLLFFRFFDKYGTHFVSSVKLGHRLYYSVAVEKSFMSNKDEIKAKLDLEYKAALVKAGAEAEAEWSKVGKKWTENRVVHVETKGGDSSLLDAVSPGFGDNHSGAFKSWREQAERNPAAVDFELTPMSELFSGEKADAMKQAFEEYAKNRVYVESKSDGSTIVVAGKVEKPAEPAEDHGSGFQVAVLDRKTLESVENSYAMFAWGSQYWSKWQQVYEKLGGILRKYEDDSRYLVIIAARGMLQNWVPPESVYQQLLALGASTNLRGWLDFIGESGSPYPLALNYILVGVPGRGIGSGAEAISRGDSVVWFHEYNHKWWWTGAKAPMTTLTVSLRPLQVQAGDGLLEPVLLSLGGTPAPQPLAEAA